MKEKNAKKLPKNREYFSRSNAEENKVILVQNL
jgi:hypothetical protein